MKVFLKYISLICVTALAGSLSAQDIDLTNFSTDTGECSAAVKSDLQKAALSTNLTSFQSYALSEVPIERRRGTSTPTGKSLKPLQTLLCLAKDGNKMLVTATDPLDNSCGWVRVDNLQAVKSKSSLLGSTMAPCGDIKPMSVGEFCATLSKLGKLTPTTEKLTQFCAIDGVNKSTIDAKFVTDNTSSRLYSQTDQRRYFKTEIPVYEQSESEQVYSTVEVLSLNEIYDVAQNRKDELRILLGVDGKLRGWVDFNSGHVWYTNLAVYFKKEGKEKIYLGQIIESQINNMEVVAQKPSAGSFTSDADYPKFPVLFDMRRRPPNAPESFTPQLQIAVIGKFCGDKRQAMLCEDQSNTSDARTLNVVGNIKTADIGQPEMNWDYFVVLDRKELSDIKRLAEDACSNLGTGDSVETATDAIIGIVQILTGDDKTPEQLVKQLQEGSIPLQTQTIIGDGLADFLMSASNKTGLDYYKKEFCRTEILLDGMQRGTKIENPEDGGDIFWNGDFYDLVYGKDFEWVFTDDLGREVFYLPFEYLPRPR